MFRRSETSEHDEACIHRRFRPQAEFKDHGVGLSEGLMEPRIVDMADCHECVRPEARAAEMMHLQYPSMQDR